MTVQPWVQWVVMPLAGYLAGSIPFGFLIGRAKGVDLRRTGSGNIGATNVARVLGRRWGYLSFGLDVAKGFVPVLAAGLILRQGGLTAGQQIAWILVALGCILGHIFTIFLGFRGGKGVATSLGVVLGFWPYLTVPGLAAFALWTVVTLASRYISLGSIIAAAAMGPLFVADSLLEGRPLGTVLPLLVFALAMAALVIYRHRGNIARLLAGTESKIGRK
jgi:acyl phosphate:glycerol-3-phosphate acyltransferase